MRLCPEGHVPRAFQLLNWSYKVCRRAGGRLVRWSHVKEALNSCLLPLSVAQRSSLTTGKMQGLLNCSHWVKHYGFCLPSYPTELLVVLTSRRLPSPKTYSAELSACQDLSSLGALMAMVTQAHVPQRFNRNHCTVNGNGWGSSRCFILLTLLWGRDILGGQLGAVTFYCSSPEVSKNQPSLSIKNPDTTLFTVLSKCVVFIFCVPNLRFSFETSGHSI